MDIQKEKIKQEFWNWAKVENPRVVENAELGDVYATKILDHMFMGFAAAKAQAVPEGFVLISAEQMSQWGHMANCAEEYGCPECFEARGYAHNLGCEINAYFNVSEAQEPANEL